MAPKENQENREKNEKNNTNDKKWSKFNISNLNSYIKDFVNSDKKLEELPIKDELLKAKYDYFINFLEERNSNLNKSIPNNDEIKNQIKNIIKEELEKRYIIRKEIINSCKKSILANFKLDWETKEKNKIDELLNKETTESLKNITTFKNIQERFLKQSEIKFSITNNDVLYLDEIDKEKLDITESKLSKEHKIYLIESINKFSSLSEIDLDELNAILELLDDKNKIKIINHFVSKLSISKLLKLGVLGIDDIKKIKKGIIKKYSENLEIIKEEDLDKIDSNFIFIDSLDNPIDSLKDSEVLYNIIDSVNQLKKDIIKEESQKKVDFLSKLKPKWENNYINDSFINYIEKDPNLSSLYTSINKFKENNYIVIEKYNEITKKSYKSVYKINEVDIWRNIYDKKISLENLSSIYWVLEKWKISDIYYEDLYELLKTPLFENEKSNIKTFISFEDKFENLKLKKVETNDEEISNKDELQFKIDEIDDGWKGYRINEKWKCSFTVWKPWDKNYWIFSIREITDNHVFLSSKDKSWNNEKLTFTEFFKAFAQNDAKRWVFIWDDINFFNNLLKKEKFNNKFEFKDWNFIEKTDDKENIRNVEYMVWKDWKSLKIENISKGFVSVSIGKCKEKDSKKIFELSYPQKISYEDLYSYIEENDLEPIFEEKNEKDDIKNVKRNSSLLKSWLSFYSVSDMVTGLTMIPKTIEESLKQWTSIKSAQFALWLWWILPDSVRLQLQSNVEAQEKKEMENLIWKWSVLDSNDFIPLLKKIILNKSSEEYEKEAALVFILKKYWVLYWKWFKEFKWSFIWYKAMWWTPNDTTYNEYKKTCADWKVPFTEEWLIEALLKKQAKWDLKPKRRSKFAKDYGWYINTWISDEKKDWENKAWALLTVKWRIWYVLWELKNQTYYNAIWWLKKIWRKWWSIDEMYAIPFLITASWLSQSLTQDALDEYYWLSISKPYSAIAFSKTKEDIDLYRKVILNLAKSIGVDAYKELENALNKDKEYERVDKLNSFWWKYWKVMVKKLNIIDDPEIFLEKDKNSEYNTYYNRMKEIYDSNDFRVEKDSVAEWIYNNDNSSFFMFSWRTFFDKAWFWVNYENYSMKDKDTKDLYTQFSNWFKKIAEMKLDKDTIKNLEKQKKLFSFYYKNFDEMLRAKFWPKRLREALKEKTWTLPIMVRDSLWIITYDEEIHWSSYDNFLNERWSEYKNRFIDWNTKTEDKIDWIKKERDSIFEEVDNLLSWKWIKKRSLENLEAILNSKKWFVQNKIILDILKDSWWSDIEKINEWYMSSHPYYWEMRWNIDKKWKIDKNNCKIILPKWYGQIKIEFWEFEYSK